MRGKQRVGGCERGSDLRLAFAHELDVGVPTLEGSSLPPLFDGAAHVSLLRVTGPTRLRPFDLLPPCLRRSAACTRALVGVAVVVVATQTIHSAHAAAVVCGGREVAGGVRGVSGWGGVLGPK